MADSVLKPDNSKIDLSPEQFRRFVEAASRAPSPDNNQPWCFRRSGSGIDVLHVRGRALPSDIDDYFSWQALGPAIENIVLSASCENLRADVRYHARPFAESTDGELVATVEFSSGAESDPLAKFIDERVSNRRPYKSVPLAESETAALEQSLHDPQCKLLWLTQPADLKALAKLVYITDRIRFEHQPFHDEFHKVLRYDDAQAKETGDGLDLKTLEIPAFAIPIFKWVRPWKRMKLANHFGLSAMFAGNSKQLVRKSGAIGLLLTTQASDERYLEAGRSLQRVWLACAAAGLAFQPMGGLPMFLTQFARKGRDAFVPEHAVRLAEIVEPFYDLFPAAREHTLVMLFRIGMAPPPSARSLRYPLERIISREDN